MNRAMVALALVLALGATAVSIYVAGHQVIPQDITLERDIQATNWGPLAITFQFFSWIGDIKGLYIEIGIFFLILIFNRRTWFFAGAAALTGGLYALISHLIVRVRPTVPPVLQVTEHPGASSYPSGHTMFIVTVTVVLMVCIGYRFLPRWARPIGWAFVALVIALNAIARIYTGAHWPSDVLGGMLIAGAWLAFLASFSWVADRVLGVQRSPDSAPEGHQVLNPAPNSGPDGRKARNPAP
jgi:undecaprenyl-diphosphatase